MGELIFADTFYAEREQLVRSQIGPDLDTLRNDMGQFFAACKGRLSGLTMRLDHTPTVNELLSFEPAKRQVFLSTFLYNDAYWRFEAAFLMLSIGMLNVAYSDLRSCLETIMTGHIIENLDSEATQFLRKGRLDLSKLSSYIPPQYNDLLAQMKEFLSVQGTHSRLRSLHLGSYGPSTLEKTISPGTLRPPQQLPEGFKDVALGCLKVSRDVLLMFFFLMHKGTKYRAEGKKSR